MFNRTASRNDRLSQYSLPFGLGALFAAALSMSAGCGQESVSEGNPAEETFTQTVLRRDSDGNTVVHSRTITASEQRAQNASRANAQAAADGDYGARTQGLNADPSCASTDMWMYDNVNGSGNMLCIAGEGVADLVNYFKDCNLYTCANWSEKVRSFWPGADGSYFTNDLAWSSPATACVRYYNKWGPLTNADSCVMSSRWIGLYVAH